MSDIDDNDALSGLLRRAGKRPQPSEEAVARIRARLHAEWVASVVRRRRQRWMALAAVVVSVGMFGILSLSLRDHAPPVAAFAAFGERYFSIGERVVASPDRGLVLQTQSPGAGNVAVRLAPGSAVRFEATDEVRLLAGSIYIDTGEPARADATPLRVLADHASIVHVGTQFLVHMSGQQVSVAVRSGHVVVRSAKNSATLQRGEQAQIGLGQDARPGIARQTVATNGEIWAWVDTLAPRLIIEGLSLHEALERLSHEAGLQLEFESAEVEATARTTVLHGPELDLPPSEALRAILATTNLIPFAETGGSSLTIRAR